MYILLNNFMCWTMHFRSFNHPHNFSGLEILSIKQKQFNLLMRLPVCQDFDSNGCAYSYIFICLFGWAKKDRYHSIYSELCLIVHMWEVRSMDEHWLHRMCNVQCAVNLFYLYVCCWTALYNIWVQCTTQKFNMTDIDYLLWLWNKFSLSLSLFPRSS